jgi:hypothetical protein
MTTENEYAAETIEDQVTRMRKMVARVKKLSPNDRAKVLEVDVLSILEMYIGAMEGINHLQKRLLELDEKEDYGYGPHIIMEFVIGRITERAKKLTLKKPKTPRTSARKPEKS